jgi:hypothetical protein
MEVFIPYMLTTIALRALEQSSALTYLMKQIWTLGCCIHPQCSFGPAVYSPAMPTRQAYDKKQF